METIIFLVPPPSFVASSEYAKMRRFIKVTVIEIEMYILLFLWSLVIIFFSMQMFLEEIFTSVWFSRRIEKYPGKRSFLPINRYLWKINFLKSCQNCHHFIHQKSAFKKHHSIARISAQILSLLQWLKYIRIQSWKKIL